MTHNPWYVVVNEPGRVVAFGPFMSWSRANDFAKMKEDKKRGVRTRCTEDDPSKFMRVIDPRISGIQ